MNCHNIYISLMVVLLVQPTAKALDIVDHCTNAVLKIRSYDVTYSVEQYAPPEPGAPSSPFETTKGRDAIAFGIGRRVEKFVETDRHMITVLDWKTASFHEDKVPAIRVGAAISSIGGACGESYLDLFNPNANYSGFFLTDLLRDNETVIHVLENSPSMPERIGFEVEHPQMRGPVRIWADPEHGYMPSTVEFYLVYKEYGKRLLERLQVKEFHQVGNSVWVPVKGSHESFSAKTGKSNGEEFLIVDVKQSSWNALHSGELFAAASMPAVTNDANRDGFKRYEPPKSLAKMKKMEKSHDDAVAKHLAEGKTSQLTHLVIGILALILLMAVFALRRYRRSKSNISA